MKPGDKFTTIYISPLYVHDNKSHNRKQSCATQSSCTAKPNPKPNPKPKPKPKPNPKPKASHVFCS